MDMFGSRASGWARAHLRRFSPACAGNTHSGRTDGRTGPVQPRMRGEHPAMPGVATCNSGSAPHARGTPPQQTTPQGLLRFSPACAGNTCPVTTLAMRSAVQPRMRGEHIVAGAVVQVTSGSAPHARGTPQNFSTFTSTLRFSPACAGNTGHCWGRRDGVAVQPRMRGEHTRPAASSCGSLGSAPHARGTREGHHGHRRSDRFSPACAGNTRASGPDSR